MDHKSSTPILIDTIVQDFDIPKQRRADRDFDTVLKLDKVRRRTHLLGHHDLKALFQGYISNTQLNIDKIKFYITFCLCKKVHCAQTLDLSQSSLGCQFTLSFNLKKEEKDAFVQKVKLWEQNVELYMKYWEELLFLKKDKKDRAFRRE